MKRTIIKRDWSVQRDRLNLTDLRASREFSKSLGENGRFLDHETPVKTTERLKAMQKTAKKYNAANLYSTKRNNGNGGKNQGATGL